MTNNLNTLFSALADPTRRAVVEHLVQNPAPVGELHAAHDMALPTFLKHIKVLEETGLVRSHKLGRVRMVHIEPASLQQIDDWLTRHRALWETRLDRLSRLANDMDRTKS
ncbi:MAG: metalloregulator ArsR/SmtB family transcription factor [Aliishimia sp.]